ncbi:hypothetical protein JO41_01465 [Treponema sp. OMZ 838]|uniref:hypothetical protein n=1 Tax=Treponema sp. OMZ 838 TaxID=1539298 RepID=UPI0005301414|nr:hypothetical protein [Treponema sp. OMZ 838]AIW88624.1 hypothetical protein JO41_01465 [Treponema sp. OMZ 838]
MRKNNYAVASFIIAVAFFIIGTDIFAADKNRPAAPGKDEIVMVFSLKLQPSPDTEFFAKYADMSFAALSLKRYGDGNDVIMFKGKNAKYFLQGWTEKDTDSGEFAMLHVGFAARKRYIEIHSLRYYFAGAEALFLTLPLQVKIEVPDDVRYVYIGDFTCKCSRPFYDITDVKRTDNFDAAAKAVKEVYGKDAELERVPLISLNKED